MTIKWVRHPKHGRYPCTSSDFDLYINAGWIAEAEADQIIKQSDVDLPPDDEDIDDDDESGEQEPEDEVTKKPKRKKRRKAKRKAAAVEPESPQE